LGSRVYLETQGKNGGKGQRSERVRQTQGEEKVLNSSKSIPGRMTRPLARLRFMHGGMSMNAHLPGDEELPDTISSAADDDFEEISSDEVDRVVESLEALASTAESENIRYFLEEATLKIYLLVYGDEEPQSEAA
jgi:hypothetical protein